MPIYTFRNKKTQETFDKIMSYSQKVKFLEENPHLESIITSAPGIGDPVRLGLRKPSDSFRDVLKNIKSHHPGSRTIKNTINDF